MMYKDMNLAKVFDCCPRHGITGLDGMLCPECKKDLEKFNNAPNGTIKLVDVKLPFDTARYRG